MIWTILIIIFCVILFGILKEKIKDSDDLYIMNLDQKFNVICYCLNEFAFNGEGEIKLENKKNITIYKEGSNQIIFLSYYSGSLFLEWKYKYFQKEIVHKKDIYSVRNLSLIEQEKLAISMIEEMVVKIKNLKEIVNNDILPYDAIAFSYEFEKVHISFKEDKVCLTFFSLHDEDTYELLLDLEDVGRIKMFESGNSIEEINGKSNLTITSFYFPEIHGQLLIHFNRDISINGWGDSLFLKLNEEQEKQRLLKINNNRKLYRFVLLQNDEFYFYDATGNSALNAIHNSEKLKELYYTDRSIFVFVKQMKNSQKSYDFYKILNFTLSYHTLNQLDLTGWKALRTSKILAKYYKDFLETSGSNIEYIK